MKVSGFFMCLGRSRHEVKGEVERSFIEEIIPLLIRKYKRIKFKVEEVVRTEEYDENKLKAYDVHFILEIPGLDIEEQTGEFSDLERTCCTGLNIVEGNW